MPCIGKAGTWHDLGQCQAVYRAGTSDVGGDLGLLVKVTTRVAGLKRETSKRRGKNFRGRSCQIL